MIHRFRVKRGGFSIRPSEGTVPANWGGGGGTNLPYGAFSSLAEHLLGFMGIPEGVMVGYGGDKPWSDADEPLAPLMRMDDFQWDFSPEECRRMAPRLRELVAQGDEYDILTGTGLADDMDYCAARGLTLEFR